MKPILRASLKIGGAAPHLDHRRFSSELLNNSSAEKYVINGGVQHPVSSMQPH